MFDPLTFHSYFEKPDSEQPDLFAPFKLPSHANRVERADFKPYVPKYPRDAIILLFIGAASVFAAVKLGDVLNKSLKQPAVTKTVVTPQPK